MFQERASQAQKKIKKCKKNPLWKKFLFFPKKTNFFQYFEKMELLYFRKWNFIAPRLKNFRRAFTNLEKLNIRCEKVSYILGNGTFLPQA